MSFDNKIVRLMVVLAAASLVGCVTMRDDKAAAVTDLTKVLPGEVSKAHNLGPTGLQGWMHVEHRRLVPGDMTTAPFTLNARQIYITKVAEGSPADGVIKVGDVILGIGDKPFDRDPRVALADAINEAEKKENGGSLKLLCWRPDTPDQEGAQTRPSGDAGVRELKLRVLGTYSDTAPYNCEKSEAILRQALEAMVARKMSTKLDLSYLALLATGEQEHFERVKKYVLSVAKSAPEPSLEAVSKARSWGTGYRLILLCEYYLLTQDETVLPAIKNLAVTLSMGQSIAGMWGHAMAQPSYNDGRLHGRIEGYAALNQPSMICFLGLVLAEKCGIEHPEFTAALDKANYYFRHYVGKGAIPYGYGPAKEYMQSNNGTSGSAAIAFAAKGDKEAAKFFSVMSAGAQTKLEVGHTGPFFNPMWTGLGANVAGPETYSEFFKQWTWMRTLNRQWDGGFAYQSPGGGGNNYRGLSADAAMILHFALPRHNLIITGRDQDKSLWLKGKEAKAAASVWELDYEDASDDALLELLGHDIPMVRGFAAKELASRGDGVLRPLAALLQGSTEEKIGACNALAEMKEAAAPALDELMELASDESEDAWARSRAVRAIATAGVAGHVHVHELLGLLMVERKGDPRRDVERYIAPYIASIVQHEEFSYAAHQDLISKAALRLMAHPHIHPRRDGMRMIRDVSLEDFNLFADSIVKVISNDDPNYTSYSGDHPAQIGLGILERLNIQDGIDLAIETMRPGIWGYHGRVHTQNGRLNLLKKYGGEAVKPYLPRLREGLRNQSEDKVKEIEDSEVNRELISLEEAKKAGGLGSSQLRTDREKN